MAHGGPIQICHRTACQYTQIEREHKAVAVIEPVWLLEAVPYQVKDVDRKAQKENQQKNTRENSFSCGIFLGGEISGNKQERQNTAINKGETLGTYCIIGNGQEFEEEIQQVNLIIADTIYQMRIYLN